MKKTATFGWPLLALIIFLSLWQFALSFGVVSSFILPSPFSVLKTLVTDREELTRALGSTALSVFLAFSLSVVIGMAAGILFFLSRRVTLALYPYTIFFQTVPIIAIAPLLVIWFGYGIPAVVASAFIVSIFPVIAGTLSGLRSVDPELRDLFQLYGASRWQALWKLHLPFSFPYLASSLRVAGGLAVIGSIVGEFLGGVGIGSIIDVARAQQRLDKVFAAVFLASLLGLLLIRLIDFVFLILLRNWHASARTPA